MKGRTLTVILTALALSFSTLGGAWAQHEGHQMPAQPVKKKATPPKKKTAARSSVRKGKTTAPSHQAGKAAPQPTKTKDTQQSSTMDHSKMDHAAMDHSTMGKKKTTARSSVRKGKTTAQSSQADKAAPQPTGSKDTQQPTTVDHSKMDHSTMDHSKMDHSTMDMRQPGSPSISKMSDESRHALVVAYAQSIATFAKTLRDKIQSTQTVDAGFALGIVDEMKRSLDAIEQQHKEHSTGMPVSTQSQMSAMMQEIQTRISALRQNLTALERELQAEAPATSSVLQRADEIIRLSGVTPGTPHQHGTGTKPDDQRIITKQEDDLKEGAVVYTCSMHPEVISDKPGKCPKCGMTLVKKKGS